MILHLHFFYTSVVVSSLIVNVKIVCIHWFLAKSELCMTCSHFHFCALQPELA